MRIAACQDYWMAFLTGEPKLALHYSRRAAASTPPSAVPDLAPPFWTPEDHVASCPCGGLKHRTVCRGAAADALAVAGGLVSALLDGPDSSLVCSILGRPPRDALVTPPQTVRCSSRWR